MNKVIHPGYRHTPTPVIAWGQALCLGAVALLMTGCSIAQPKTFSLEADVPENFTVTGTANYKPAPGQTCPPASDEERDTGRLFFRPKQPKTAIRSNSRYRSQIRHMAAQWYCGGWF